jgi:transcriptional regulator with XRE-family HTH domain
VDVCLVVKQRLEQLGLEQKDLAAAADVTESYISQLLTRKKLPPAPNRTDIYEKMGMFLKLPTSKLAKLAELQRREALKQTFEAPPAPLFHEVRELVLRKCTPEKQREIRAIFERQPFGELERLVTQALLEAIKRVARKELDSEKWLRSLAQLSGLSYREMRVVILEFLDTDVFHVSLESCVSFLDPLIESWDIDLSSFAMQIVLNRRLAPEHSKRLEFVETDSGQPSGDEPGLTGFLEDPSLSGNVTPEELEFLRRLRVSGKRPTQLYYYRELQNLRDPLHFAPSPSTYRVKTSRPTGVMRMSRPSRNRSANQ